MTVFHWGSQYDKPLLEITVRSFTSIDRGVAIDSIGYFSKSAVLEFCHPASNAGVLNGRAEVEIFLKSRMAMTLVEYQHIIRNFLVEKESDNILEASYQMIV